MATIMHRMATLECKYLKKDGARINRRRPKFRHKQWRGTERKFFNHMLEKAGRRFFEFIYARRSVPF